MEIIKITIKNFKSIRSQICFDIKSISNKKCFILLGINESGKSNILEAISLPYAYGDISYSAICNNEAEENEEDVEVIYDFCIKDHDFYAKKIIAQGVDKALVDKIKITEVKRHLSVDMKSEMKDYFFVSTKANKKELEKYVIIKEDSMIDGTKKIETIGLKTDENITYNDEGIPNNILNQHVLGLFLGAKLGDIFYENIPDIISWKSEDKYLIKEKINLNEFKEKPYISVPLRNCFKIAGITDIKKKIDSVSNNQAKQEQLKDLLNEKITRHINTVWKEHKINIRFVINDMELSFYVEDQDNSLPKYAVEQRSDGFKHFLSILLNLSAENEISTLKNSIVLLDEPEVHLHPTGEKYLRDELLKISKNNVVFFATHSIYMVDKVNLDRHFSVKKEKGVTNLYPIEKDNPYKEEVLYEALGTSILEHIESSVLITEGKTDRDIFELYKKKFRLEVKIPNFSLISADGCDNIQKYTKFFNKKLVYGFVLLDSDAEGKAKKNDVLKEKGYNNKNTFEINDVLDTKKESTLEDLFNEKYLIECIGELYDGFIITLDCREPFLRQAIDQLHKNQKAFRKTEKERLSKLFFQKISKLTKKELKEEKYYNFFVELGAKLVK